MNNLRSILGDAFRPDEYETQQDFSEPVNPGRYPVQILEAVIKPTKRQDGYYVELDMQILDGEYKGRHLWHRINIDNPSKEARRIGRSMLATIGKALCLKELDDTTQLVNGVVIAHVKVKTDEQYGDQNDITTYSAISGKPSQNKDEEPAYQLKDATASKPPWMR